MAAIVPGSFQIYISDLFMPLFTEYAAHVTCD